MGTSSRRKPESKSPLSARSADRYLLYESAVQNVESEIDFVDSRYFRIRGRRAIRLREDFCGTAASACEWVRRRARNLAVGLDLHAPTLRRARRMAAGRLNAGQLARLKLLRKDVVHPDRGCGGMDVILAMNFSYFTFTTRDELCAYFRAVKRSLAPGGVFFLDHFGGPEAMEVLQERRRERGFTYVWEQASYNPITGEYLCHIHFRFADGTAIKRAFTYHWRLWTLPELQDVLRDAGFRNVTVYWEGDDDRGGGNGVFRASRKAEVCKTYITYVSAER